MNLETTDDYHKSNKSDPMSKLIKRVDLDYQHARMIEYFIKNKIYSYKIVEANSDYYSLNLEERKDVLGAHSLDVLCKTIVLENTSFDSKYESQYYQRYYLTLVQYTNEFHAEKLSKSMKAIQNENCETKLSNKYFHFRLAKNEVAFEMTGYKFNCITPYLMKDQNVQILFPKNLLNIYPQYFWIGGGELELKVGMSIDDFIKLYSNRSIIIDLSAK